MREFEFSRMADTITETTQTQPKRSMGQPRATSLAEMSIDLSGFGNMGNFGGPDQDQGAAEGAAAPPLPEGTPEGPKQGAGTPQSTPAQGTPEGTPQGAPEGPQEGAGATPSADQIKAFFEANGIPWDGDVNALKTKLNPSQAPTEAEVRAREEAHEKRVLNHYINDLGGKPEDYVALKNLAGTPAEELAHTVLRNELMTENGFSQEQAEEIIAQRYFQYSDEDIDLLEDEADKDILRKKRAYGAKQLANRALPHIEQAKAALKELTDAITAQDFLGEQEAKLSSKIDEMLSKTNRKLVFQLGENNGQKIDPIEYNIADADIAEVSGLLKDPAKRQAFFYNPDNSLNLDNVTNVLLRNKYLESALKTAYLTGSTREVETVQKVFPFSNPRDLGVGGAASGGSQATTGKFKAAGKPQVVR